MVTGLDPKSFSISVNALFWVSESPIEIVPSFLSFKSLISFILLSFITTTDRIDTSVSLPVIFEKASLVLNIYQLPTANNKERITMRTFPKARLNRFTLLPICK